MLATNHVLAGALIGSVLPLPVALPVAFASHFVMDSIPHYGMPGTKRDKSLSYKTIIYIDIVVALSFNLLLFGHFPHKWSMWTCAVAAASGDFSLVYYYLKYRTLNTTHNGLLKKAHLQFHYERPWLIIPELTLTAVLFTLFLNRIT